MELSRRSCGPQPHPLTPLPRRPEAPRLLSFLVRQERKPHFYRRTRNGTRMECSESTLTVILERQRETHMVEQVRQVLRPVFDRNMPPAAPHYAPREPKRTGPDSVFWLAAHLDRQVAPSRRLLRAVAMANYGYVVTRATWFGALVNRLPDASLRRHALQVLCLESGLATPADRALLGSAMCDSTSESMASLYRRTIASLGGNPSRCLSWTPSPMVTAFERQLQDASSASAIGGVLLGWEQPAAQLNRAFLGAIERSAECRGVNTAYFNVRAVLSTAHEQNLIRYARAISADTAVRSEREKGRVFGRLAFRSLFMALESVLED